MFLFPQLAGTAITSAQLQLVNYLVDGAVDSGTVTMVQTASDMLQRVLDTFQTREKQSPWGTGSTNETKHCGVLGD